MSGPLAGRRIVVTRAAGQAGRLSQLLVDQGATVVEVPVIAIVDPDDGGEALQAALREVWDWVVVTSPNGADRAVAAAGGRAAAFALAWAVIGPGTAEALSHHGITAALVPERSVAEALLEAFPLPPSDHVGRVLVAQAEQARPVLAAGLRERGWDVTTAVAYRTIAVRPPADALVRARGADAIAFTSGSTVKSFLAGAGRDALPPVVAAIGPVTAEVARAHGIDVAAVADTYTLDGLVAALAEAVGGARPA